jgi:hypothetical protein
MIGGTQRNAAMGRRQEDIQNAPTKKHVTGPTSWIPRAQVTASFVRAKMDVKKRKWKTPNALAHF